MLHECKEWFLALFLSLAITVSLLGAARHIDERARTMEAAADTLTIVVDAGHGGSDGGAVGATSGTPEAGLNLDVAKKLAEALTQRGAAVLLTRADENALAQTKDADMAARRRIFRRNEVDLVVSVHMNEFTDPSVSGAMAYYMHGSTEGQKLAQAVIDRVCEATGQDKRLANPGDYFVLRECASPSVLVECGFLSNASDEALLTTEAHRALLANAIAAGVFDYLQPPS